MEIGECPFSEVLLNRREVYRFEASEYAPLPVSICQESVQVRIRYSFCKAFDLYDELHYMVGQILSIRTPLACQRSLINGECVPSNIPKVGETTTPSWI
jgi:hypothetical protein